MFHNGYLVHPEIWQLWFSFAVSALVVIYTVVKIVAFVYNVYCAKGDLR